MERFTVSEVGGALQICLQQYEFKGRIFNIIDRFWLLLEVKYNKIIKWSIMVFYVAI